MRLHLVTDSGREPSAWTNGADAYGEAKVARILSESASLPEYFRARRVLIENITAAIHWAAESEDDPEMRRAFFSVALEDSETLASLEERYEERITL